jgi:hypothetical protein
VRQGGCGHDGGSGRLTADSLDKAPWANVLVAIAHFEIGHRPEARAPASGPTPIYGSAEHRKWNLRMDIGPHKYSDKLGDKPPETKIPATSAKPLVLVETTERPYEPAP